MKAAPAPTETAICKCNCPKGYTQCGEEYLNGVTLQKIEGIVKKIKSVWTEIAVVDFNTAA